MPKEPIFTIAPLVWSGRIEKAYDEILAKASFGRYFIYAYSEDGESWWLTSGIDADGSAILSLPDPETIERGKAYAEAHWQALMKRGLKEVK